MTTQDQIIHQSVSGGGARRGVLTAAAGAAAAAVLGLTVCASAWAADQPAPAAEAPAEAPKARVTKKDCQRLVRHQARADVAYKPGVDVRGKKVAPADLAGSFQMVLPDVFEFNVTKDLTAYLGGAEEALAAQKAAALAAEKSATATDAAVSSAALSLDGAQDQYDSAVATYEAAQAAAAADTDNAELAATAASAKTLADAAETNLATTQSAYDATVSAAASNDVASALSNSNSTLSAAQDMGYVQDESASTATTAAATAAEASYSADAAALSAQETVSKSEGMTLNAGTVRYNIKTGAMTFNGQPLNDAATGEMAEICKEILGSGK
jgi:G:T/U-mismatch repair DNA glycosylase